MQIVVLVMRMPMKLTLTIKWIMKCNVGFGQTGKVFINIRNVGRLI